MCHSDRVQQDARRNLAGYWIGAGLRTTGGEARDGIQVELLYVRVSSDYDGGDLANLLEGAAGQDRRFRQVGLSRYGSADGIRDDQHGDLADVQWDLAAAAGDIAGGIQCVSDQAGASIFAFSVSALESSFVAPDRDRGGNACLRIHGV